MSTGSVVYLDSSAIVKLVVSEPESAAVRQFLGERTPLVSSALARAEVSRAVLALDSRTQDATQQVLRRIDLLRVTNRILNVAGTLQPDLLRTLDAIHIASALSLDDTLSDFVCYDRRLSRAAADRGWRVESPS